MKVVLATNVLVSGVFFSSPPRQILEPFLALLATNAVIVDPRPVLEAVVSDSTDDMLFACPLGAGCRLIISGDRRVLAASGYDGVEVIRPRSFVERYL